MFIQQFFNFQTFKRQQTAVDDVDDDSWPCVVADLVFEATTFDRATVFTLFPHVTGIS